MAKKPPETLEFNEDDEATDTDDFDQIEDTDEQDETPERPALQPFPAAMYRFAILAALAVTGRCSYELYQTHKNPDSRTPTEMTRAFLTARNRLNLGHEPLEPPNEEVVQSVVYNSICVLNQMGHPLGDTYVPNGEKALEKRENKRTSSDFFLYDPNPGRTPPKKYVYQSNTHCYTLEGRIADTIATITQQKNDPDKDIQETVSWLTMDPEELLSQPLACVRGYDGSCLQTWEHTDCLLLEPLADAITAVNLKYHRVKAGAQLEPIVCFRNDLHQALAYVSISGKNCKESLEEGGREGLMMTGNSSHGMGLAVDFADEKQAKEFLEEIGMACGFIRGDEGHCSFGEKAMIGFRVKWKLKIRKAKDTLRTGKDVGKKVWRTLRGR